ncbi:hypothetical protein MRB53_039103 [Persea americana]|nr:hypothetical protein MRB53_039103 [Persea americana]
MDLPTSSSIRRLSNRTNIVARTCDDHYPKIMPRWRCDLGSSVPWDIDYKAVFSHPVPSSESLVLLSFGCSNNDRSIIMEGNRRYLAAVESIRRDISSIAVPADLNRKVCFIAMKILTLSLCEQFKTISPDGAGWIKHVNGVNAIFKATNRPVPADQRFIVWTARHVCLVMSLSRRQAMDERLFFRLLHASGEYERPRSGSTEQLYQLCVPLPRMLQLTDILYHSQHANPMTLTRLHAASSASSASSPPGPTTSSPCRPACTSSAAPTATRFSTWKPSQARTWTWARLAGPRWPHRITALVEHLIDALVLFANVMQPFTRLQQMSGILHFLTQHLERSGSEDLLQRCRDWGTALRRDNDHVIWDARVPWSFFPMSALLRIEMQAAADEP